ncbi:MAG: D-alanyl-D-alanine carboxypeptidase [Oscillospiraceae bacterium]|jgi:D-alanyl-D-alanine carboxypeptidase (penicillin-binding protein 5/6)|nr:D-alanyl-D-alanine carboxypeptidase [Oscillospiraceae bacterium]
MRDIKNAAVAVIIILTIALNIDSGAVLRVSAFEPGIETIYSDSVFMVHLETDIPVFRRNEFERVVPASTTKIMTALLVLDHVENLNSFVTVTDEMNSRFQSNPNFTYVQAADIQIGQTNVTYMDCLYALMIYSACDAANVLAYSVGGTIDNFVAMMNQKAQELGAVNTNFTNAHGLHENNNYTCAFDMFKITQYAYDKHPAFMQIVGTRDHRMPANSRNSDGEVLPNTNRMLFRDSAYYYEPVIGVKTGSLDELYDTDTGERAPGLFNLVTIATRDGHTYMIVSLNAPYHDEPFNRGFFAYTDHLELYRWAFSSLEYKLILPEHDVIAQGDVRDGIEDRIQMRPAGEFSYMLPRNLDRNAVHKEITINWHCGEERVFFAPIERGEVLGYVELMLAGEVLTRINLIAVSEVSPSLESRILGNVTGIFGEWWFQTGVALVAALMIFIIILRLINNQREKNRRMARSRSSSNRNRRNLP